MKKIFGKNSLIYMILFAVLIFFGLFLFSIDKDRRAISMSADNIHILLNNTKWTTNNIELTVKYDGDASKHIDSYSFDGGVSWTKSNILILDDNKELSILVKDILGRMYSVNYNVDNIDKEGPKIKVKKNIKIKKGSKTDLKKYLDITDEKSGVDKIIITPKKINTNKLGKHKIKVVVYDKLGNKSTKKFDIKVVKKI